MFIGITLYNVFAFRFFSSIKSYDFLNIQQQINNHWFNPNIIHERRNELCALLKRERDHNNKIYRKKKERKRKQKKVKKRLTPSKPSYKQ